MVAAVSFGDWAEKAHDSGFSPVPLQGKKPMLRNWNSRPLGLRAIRNLIARDPTVASANLGLRTGKLVAIDIDVDDPVMSARVAATAAGVLGLTQFIRIGRTPRRMLFYRTEEATPSRKIGKVEILGTGKVAVVLGVHPDTSRPYEWPDECLLDFTFSDVPLVSRADLAWFARWLEAMQQERPPHKTNDALDSAVRAAIAGLGRRLGRRRGSVTEGERNETLFRDLKNRASKSRSQQALLDEARRINEDFQPPLPDREVVTVTASVWKYRQEGRLIVAGQQSIVLPVGKEAVIAMSVCADAVYLLALLKATRTNKHFTIPQKATAKRIGWGSNRLKKAIDALITAGWIRTVPSTGTRRFCELTRYEYGVF